MAGKDRGRGAAPGEQECAQTPGVGSGQATDPTLQCYLCSLSGHLPSRATLNHQHPARLRVALVDGDPAAHEFVRQAFTKHATGWALESHPSPDSLLAALGRAALTEELSTINSPNHQLPSPLCLPDVLLLEAHWAGLSGRESLRRLMARLPNPRIVMLTDRSDHDTIMELLLA